MKMNEKWQPSRDGLHDIAYDLPSRSSSLRDLCGLKVGLMLGEEYKGEPVLINQSLSVIRYQVNAHRQYCDKLTQTQQDSLVTQMGGELQ